MTICLEFPLLARAISLNHQFLVVTREHDSQEDRGGTKRIFGGNRGLEMGGMENLKCVWSDNLRMGLPETVL